MKLWLLRPIDTWAGTATGPWEPWYDKSFGFVVRAECEVDARTMLDEECGDEKHDNGGVSPWRSAELSTCVELTADGATEVIMKDFASA